jgi:hypothetical protein
MATEAHGKTRTIRSILPCLPCDSVAINHVWVLSKRHSALPGFSFVSGDNPGVLTRLPLLAEFGLMRSAFSSGRGVINSDGITWKTREKNNVYSVSFRVRPWHRGADKIHSCRGEVPLLHRPGASGISMLADGLLSLLRGKRRVTISPGRLSPSTSSAWCNPATAFTRLNPRPLPGV